MSSAKKKHLYEQLRDQVLTLHLAPGTIIDEIELAEAFAVSRTPLREVIQRLAGEGYFQVEQNRGARVAPMDLETMRQFFQAAPMIYASIARLAAENATPGKLDQLKDIQRHYRQSLANNDATATAMHNHQFHQQIGVIAGSPYLLPSLNRLLVDHTRIGQSFYQQRSNEDRERITKAADQHDEMIVAFENRSPAEAVEITLQHWELSRHRMETFVRPDPLPHNLEEISDAV